MGNVDRDSTDHVRCESLIGRYARPYWFQSRHLPQAMGSVASAPLFHFTQPMPL